MNDLQFHVGFRNTRWKDQHNYILQKNISGVVKLKNKASHNKAKFEIKLRTKSSGPMTERIVPDV